VHVFTSPNVDEHLILEQAKTLTKTKPHEEFRAVSQDAARQTDPIDKGGALLEDFNHAAKKLKATHEFNLGSAKFLGADTRIEAKSIFAGQRQESWIPASKWQWGSHTTSKADREAVGDSETTQSEKGFVALEQANRESCAMKK
jgi:hypothetical protein